MSKLAVITGGAKGLGAAMAERLLADGFRVEAWDLKVETAVKHANFSIRALDVTDEAQVKAASQDYLQKFGIPHVVINNAGITQDALLHKMTLTQFERAWKVSVQGTFLVTQALGSAMREEASALQKKNAQPAFRRIIALSSIAGITGNVGQANYAAAKAAVVGFVKSVAKEWGRYNISAVAVAPGLMKTEMTQTIPPEVLQNFIERTPLKRMGEPSELAGLISYLAREESAFLTGEVLSFSGGLLL